MVVYEVTKNNLHAQKYISNPLIYKGHNIEFDSILLLYQQIL